MSPNVFAIVAGAGPGTGAAVARKFAKVYPVVLLARSEDSYKSLVDEIKGTGGSAIGISTDVSSGDSIRAAFAKVKSEMGDDVTCAAAIFNASTRPSRKSFLDVTEDEFAAGLAVGGKGAFNFAQSALPLLLKNAETKPQHPPTLIFTGATASVKGSAMFSSFAPPKFAQRALAQSLAREFSPKGVHIGHVIVDGIIATPMTKNWMPDAAPDAKLSPDAIADTYWHLHTQPLNCFTWEVEIRPHCEKW